MLLVICHSLKEEQAQEALHRLNAELEQRIAQRTAHREAATTALKLELAERVRVEQELRRYRQERHEYIDSMSHELRTPLTATIGFTGTLRMGLLDPLTADEEKQPRTVQRSAQHLLSLINDMLDLTTIESGKVELRLEPVVCQEVIAEVVASMQALAEQKGMVLEVSVSVEAIVVRTDRRALSQMLIHLINNAIKFTETGGVPISASWTPVLASTLTIRRNCFRRLARWTARTPAGTKALDWACISRRSWPSCSAGRSRSRVSRVPGALSEWSYPKHDTACAKDV